MVCVEVWVELEDGGVVYVEQGGENGEVCGVGFDYSYFVVIGSVCNGWDVDCFSFIVICEYIVWRMICKVWGCNEWFQGYGFYLKYLSGLGVVLNLFQFDLKDYFLSSENF